MDRSKFVRVVGMGAAAVLAAAAWAGPQDSGKQADKATDPLSGPKVESREVPGVDGQFGEGRRDKMRAGGRTPTRMFLGAIRSLESPETPEELQLTDEQRDEIRAIAEELRGAMQAYRAEHKEELDALRDEAPAGARRGARPQGDGPPPQGDGQRAQGQGQRQRRGAGGPQGQRPPAGAEDGAPPPPPPPPPVDDATREKLAEIMKDAPKPEPYHTRMWAVLSAAQQEVVRERLDAAIAEGANGDDARPPRGERQRNAGARGKGPADGPPPGGKRPPPPGDL